MACTTTLSNWGNFSCYCAGNRHLQYMGGISEFLILEYALSLAYGYSCGHFLGHLMKRPCPKGCGGRVWNGAMDGIVAALL